MKLAGKIIIFVNILIFLAAIICAPLAIMDLIDRIIFVSLAFAALVLNMLSLIVFVFNDWFND